MFYLPEKVQEMISDLVSVLPDYMRNTLAAFDWQNEIVRVGAKYQLNDSQNQNLIVETALVILGVSEPVTYVQTIENYLGVSEEIAENIALEIVDRVINPLQENMIELNRDEILNLQNQVTRAEQEAGQAVSFQDLGIELGVLEAGDIILDDSQVPVPENNEMYNQLMSQRAPLTEMSTRGVRSSDGMTRRVAHVAGLSAQNQPPIAPEGALQDAMIAQQSPVQMPIDRALENEVDHLFGSNDQQLSTVPIQGVVADDIQTQWQEVIPQSYEAEDPYHEILDESGEDDPAANWR